MNVGCETAYQAGIDSFFNCGCWSEPPEEYSETEKELWQEGFDNALQRQLNLHEEEDNLF